MDVIRGVIFDLDDTLYFERDYVRSGFLAVASHVSMHSSLPANQVFDELWAGFEGGVRGNSFDRFLTSHPEIACDVGVGNLVSVYRGQQPEISLLPWVRPCLRWLRERGVAIGILSDGDAFCQEAKYCALGLHRMVDLRVLTGALGPAYEKPSTGGFALIQGLLRLRGGELAYIGDNPAKDFQGPKHLGWWTIRLRCCEQLHYRLAPEHAENAADEVANSGSELRTLLAARTYGATVTTTWPEPGPLRARSRAVAEHLGITSQGRGSSSPPGETP